MKSLIKTVGILPHQNIACETPHPSHGGLFQALWETQTREISIRMALGATPRSVLMLFVRKGVPTTTTGLFVGTILSFFRDTSAAERTVGNKADRSACVPRCICLAELGFIVSNLFRGVESGWCRPSPGAKLRVTEPALGLATEINVEIRRIGCSTLGEIIASREAGGTKRGTRRRDLRASAPGERDKVSLPLL